MAEKFSAFYDDLEHEKAARRDVEAGPAAASRRPRTACS
jgi:hypothetical protein